MSDRNVHLTPKDAAQPQAPRRVVEWAQAAQVPPSATGVVTIDLAQIRANWRTLAKRVAPAGCGAVVKADAYGLGAARVIPTLYEAGCRNFFVATQAEAKTAIALAPGATIYVLDGILPGCARELAAHRRAPRHGEPR